MEPAAPSHKKQIITGVAVLVAITLIVMATVLASKKKPDMSNASTDSTASTSQTATDNPSPATDPAATPATYTDGSYSANATYQSPGGTEAIQVKVTIAGGVVTDSTVTTTPNESEGREYQAMFLAGYKSQVVGKSVDTIKLSRVSGSSLTSQGFNSALTTIKQQAKAQS